MSRVVRVVCALVLMAVAHTARGQFLSTSEGELLITAHFRLTLQAPDGRITGVNRFDIPNSSYDTDAFVIDDGTGGPVECTLHVGKPQSGRYLLTVSTDEPGVSNVYVELLLPYGGKSQLTLKAPAAPGMDARFALQVDSETGYGVTATRMTDFAGTMNDIKIARDNQLIADALLYQRLLALIRNADSAQKKQAHSTMSSYLNAFKRAVQLSADTAVEDVARDILLEDADSLQGLPPKASPAYVDPGRWEWRSIQQNEASWKELKSKYGWSIRFPKNWLVNAIGDEAPETYESPDFSGPVECREEPIHWCAQFQIDAMPRQGEDISRLTPREYLGRYPDSRQRVGRPICLDGHLGYQTFSLTSSGGYGPSRTIAVKHNGKFLIITYGEQVEGRPTIKSPDYWMRVGVFNEILTTFRFTDEKREDCK